jgi:hypothetical protein
MIKELLLLLLLSLTMANLRCHPTGLDGSYAKVVYRQGTQGRGQDREYPLKGRSPRNCDCCLGRQHRKGGETSCRRAAPKPPNERQAPTSVARPLSPRVGPTKPEPPRSAQRPLSPRGEASSNPVPGHYRRAARKPGAWCLLFVLIRHGEEGATSLHAGLERLGKETGEPTGPLGPTP